MTTVIDKGHSRFGGSVIGRVIACPASVYECDAIPELLDDEYSSEGTAAAFVAEQCLKESLPAEHWLDHTYTRPGMKPIKVDRDMVNAVQVFLDEVNRELALTPDAELYVEHSFELDSDAAPGEVWGKTDALVYHPSIGRLRDFDYKHGVGVSVSAEDNAQPKFYATGAVFSHPEWRIAELICTIVQPRARDVDYAGAVKDWTFNVAALLDFQGEIEDGIVRAKAAAVKLADPALAIEERLTHYAVGDHCRWCDASGTCVAKEAASMKAATLKGQKVTEIRAADLPEPKSLDVERLAAVVAGIDIVREWQLRCQELLEGLVLSGVEVPGWKAVEKIGRAKWIEDPASIVAHAELMFGIEEDSILPRKLATITEAEKLLKAAGATKEQIDDFKMKFTIKESSGLTLAPASDRRPSVNAAAENFGAAKLGN